jgi:hypothetical protein
MSVPSTRVYVLFLSVCVLAAGVTSAGSLDEVRSCLAANLPRSSSEIWLKLQSRGRAGRTSTHEVRVYWRRSEEGDSQTLLCMTSPRDLRGLAYLIHEGPSGQAVWAYLPDEERTVRLNARSAAGRAHISRTAISYEDLRYLPLNLAAAQSRAAADEKLGDREVAVVELGLPPKSESRYARILARVDRETCVPLEIEFWEPGEKQTKTLRADPDTIRDEGGARLAHALIVEDRSREVQTEVTIEKVEMDPELPERIFEPPLRRSHCPP